MAAREDDAASKRNSSEEEEDSSPEPADQKADETVAGAAAMAEVDQCSDDDVDDDEDDLVIRNLNLMSRLNLMTPEWIENRRKLQYEEIDLFNRSYDALEAMENGDYEPDDEAAIAEHEEWSKRLWASVDLIDLNTVNGEYAVAVYPVGVKPPEEEEEEKHHPAAAESSS